MTVETILDEWKELETEDIEQALAYAAMNLNERVILQKEPDV